MSDSETATQRRSDPYLHPANIAAERAFYQDTNTDPRSTQGGQYGRRAG